MNSKMTKAKKKKDAAVGKQFRVGRHTVMVEDVLNEGGFAVIFVVHDDKGNRWAMKRIRLNNFRDFLQVRFEAETMKTMSQASNNVVRYVDDNVQEVSAAFRRAGTPHESDRTYEVLLLTEYYPRNVLQLINERLQDRRMLRESEVLHIFCDVCAAVGQMHSREPPIIHRDLKIENILISASGRYILCDFGSATNRTQDPARDDVNVIREDLERYTTTAYRAPEMINLYNQYPISTKADVWALGVLLYKLCFFNDPFGNSHLAIENAKYAIPAQHHYRPEVMALIKLCLNPDPALRPDIFQLSDVACDLAQRRCTVPNINNSSTINLNTLMTAQASSSAAANTSTALSASPKSSNNFAVFDSVTAAAAAQQQVNEQQSRMLTTEQQQPSVLRNSFSNRNNSNNTAENLPTTTSVAPRERPRAIGGAKLVSGSITAAALLPFPTTTTTISNPIATTCVERSNLAAPALQVPIPSPSSSSSTMATSNNTVMPTDSNSTIIEPNTFETVFDNESAVAEKNLLQLSDDSANSTPGNTESPSSSLLSSSVASNASGNNNAVAVAIARTNNKVIPAAALVAEFEEFFKNSSFPDPFNDNDDGDADVTVAAAEPSTATIPIRAPPVDDEVNLINISSSPPPLTPSIQQHLEQLFQHHQHQQKPSVPPKPTITQQQQQQQHNTAAVLESINEQVFQIPILLPHQHRTTDSLSLRKKSSNKSSSKSSNAAAVAVVSAAIAVSPPPQQRATSPVIELNRDTSVNNTDAVLPKKPVAVTGYERLGDYDHDLSDAESNPNSSNRTQTNKQHQQLRGRAAGVTAASLSSLSSSASSLVGNVASGGAAAVQQQQQQQQSPSSSLSFLQQNGVAIERSMVDNNNSIAAAAGVGSLSDDDDECDDDDDDDAGGEKYTPSSPEHDTSTSESDDAGGGEGKRKKRNVKKAPSAAAAPKTTTAAAASSAASLPAVMRKLIDPPPSSASSRRRDHLLSGQQQQQQQQLSPLPSLALASTSAARNNSHKMTASSSSSSTAVDPFSNAPGFFASGSAGLINSKREDLHQRFPQQQSPKTTTAPPSVVQRKISNSNHQTRRISGEDDGTVTPTPLNSTANPFAISSSVSSTSRENRIITRPLVITSNVQNKQLLQPDDKEKHPVSPGVSAIAAAFQALHTTSSSAKTANVASSVRRRGATNTDDAGTKTAIATSGAAATTTGSGLKLSMSFDGTAPPKPPIAAKSALLTNAAKQNNFTVPGEDNSRVVLRRTLQSADGGGGSMPAANNAPTTRRG